MRTLPAPRRRPFACRPAVCAALLALAGCVAPLPATNPGPIPPHIPHSPVPNGAQDPVVIRDDRGGNVVATVVRREQLEASGRPVEIRGYCRSACTMLITLPNACLAPDARVGFHAPRVKGTEIIPPAVDQIMAGFYRNGIRERWQQDWRNNLQMTIISAREYKALDPQTRLCDS